MVRHQVNCTSERSDEPETKSRGRRHATSHPPDNIDGSCTVQSIHSEDTALRGKRRVLVVPRDNIGVACLPTTDRLDNILELTEYESSNEDDLSKTLRKSSRNRRSKLSQTAVRVRERINSTRDSIFAADQSTTSSDKLEQTNQPSSRFERGRLCKRRDTIGLLWHETNKDTFKKSNECKKSDHKFQGEMGMSNVRVPKDDLARPRKPIIPRDNIGFGCKFLHKSAGRLSAPKLSTGINYKVSYNDQSSDDQIFSSKSSFVIPDSQTEMFSIYTARALYEQNSSNPVERKNTLHGRSAKERNEETTREQIDTLRTVSKLSVLLLYIHFLLTYYLSYAKSHRYGEIFDSCPIQDAYE